MKAAIITGASSGIGFQLAREFARNGYDLFLTARHEPELRSAATSLAQEFGVRTESVARDLNDPDAPSAIQEAAAHSGMDFEVLVNDAGFGQKGRFWEIPLERHLSIIRVNVEALVSLTMHFLPGFPQQGRGRILNLASIGSFQPGPLLSVYYASKAFVLSFSEALSVELEGTGVSVTALAPGATDTEFFLEADMENTTIFQKGNVMDPETVAKEGYEALMNGELLHVPGGINKALAFSTRLMSQGAQAKFAQRMHTDVDPEDRKREVGDIANKDEPSR